MKFIDLLDVLESNAQLSVLVTNEWGDRVYDGTVGHFWEEKGLLTNLKVCRVYTLPVMKEVQSEFYPKPLSFIIKIYVTLYDDEHKIIFPED